MIGALRTKLVRLMTLMLGAILLLTAGAAYMVSERQQSLSERAAFDAQVNSIERDVDMGRVMKNTELGKLEVTGAMILSIWDGGQPIDFRGGWQPVTSRDELIEHAIAQSEQDARWDGAIRGDQNERYLTSVRRLEGYRSSKMVVALKDMRKADEARIWQRVVIVLIALVGLALLTVFAWLFTGRAVHPIEEAHAQQNRFVAAASHELRTPLQVMQAASEALRGEPGDAPFIDQIGREVKRMSRLTNDLLILTAAHGLSMGPVEVDELVHAAHESYIVAAEQKGIRLSCVLPEASYPIVEGDRAALERALNVLVDNAIEYTPPGGRVVIAAMRSAGQIELSVEDDGPGVDEQHRARIFEQFYRADASRSDRAHNGLGLSIAEQIIQRHNGRIGYQPVEPHGSRFVIKLNVLRVIE